MARKQRNQRLRSTRDYYKRKKLNDSRGWESVMMEKYSNKAGQDDTNEGGNDK